MRIDIVVFSLIGMALILGFLRQFLDLRGRGLVYALAALGALLGLSTLYSMRKTRLSREIDAGNERLDRQSEQLRALAGRYGESNASIRRAMETLQRARIDGQRQLAEIEAEGSMDLADAREYARRLSADELLARIAPISAPAGDENNG